MKKTKQPAARKNAKRKTVSKPVKVRTRKNKPGAGRPHISLDEKKIGKLAFQGCKNSEIALIIGCDDETLKNNYSRILDKKRAERRAAFRETQTLKALAGDTAMLIFLGKNELEQSDKQDVNHSGSVAIPVTFIMPRPGDRPAAEPK
jgi:DNA-binding NarL/FixJ family response regulator